ncbi:hypothetical protein QBC44DRAFT_63260 [Cladorrhinum sp. PSN332]|nr:hypothetical protein QBC44DRAFT_63260 [Cladorrhinum sp. PSN332]
MLSFFVICISVSCTCTSSPIQLTARRIDGSLSGVSFQLKQGYQTCITAVSCVVVVMFQNPTSSNPSLLYYATNYAQHKQSQCMFMSEHDAYIGTISIQNSRIRVDGKGQGARHQALSTLDAILHFERKASM